MHLLFSQAAITHPTTWLARNPMESMRTALPAPLAVQLHAKPGNSYCTEVPSRSELTSLLKLLVRNSSPRSSHALSSPLAFRRNQAVQLGLGDTLNEGRWSLQQMYCGAEGITANCCCHYCTGLWKGKPLSKIERSTAASLLEWKKTCISIPVLCCFLMCKVTFASPFCQVFFWL